MNATELRQCADAIEWWHGGMDLGHGVITQGAQQPAMSLLPRLVLPELAGKSVIDVCTWDGYIAFECERRGASRVVATDSLAWNKDSDPNLMPYRTGRDGFDLAHEALNSKVEAVECEVLDLSPHKLGTFDVVLFLGVIYHMRHPLLALERVAALCDDLLILESYVETTENDAPLMRFLPDSSLNDDPTNWWAPNTACIEAMLRDVGLAEVSIVSTFGNRAVFHARKVAA